jgi:hypothetical protein
MPDCWLLCLRIINTALNNFIVVFFMIKIILNENKSVSDNLDNISVSLPSGLQDGDILVFE